MVCIAGDVDTAVADELWSATQARLEQAGRALVLGLAEMTFFGSAGITLVISVWNACWDRVHCGSRALHGAQAAADHSGR
ncbi:hypothetical protein [Lentzea guizhouensis]|nr:hypothetical protein [Lentzea guizhouensis]